MGLIDFIKDVGHKLNIGGHDDPKPAQAAPKAAQGPSQQEIHALENRKKVTALTNLIQQMGLKGENLNVQVDGEKVTLTGKVDSQEVREKIVLLVGNTEGIGKVDDQLQVTRPEPQAAQVEAQYYDVKAGDSLSKIAKQVYGDANQYNRIFEANQPMLKDPDKIYPGQKLRIPALATTSARA